MALLGAHGCYECRDYSTLVICISCLFCGQCKVAANHGPVLKRLASTLEAVHALLDLPVLDRGDYYKLEDPSGRGRMVLTTQRGQPFYHQFFQGIGLFTKPTCRHWDFTLVEGDLGGLDLMRIAMEHNPGNPHTKYIGLFSTNALAP